MSLRLPDGTLVQVGKSTEARDDLLARFRAALGIVTLSIVAIALTGGLLATRIGRAADPAADAAVPASSDRPDRRARAVRVMAMREARVTSTDAIDELTMLFNAMLDKIEGLVTGMRGALDNVSHDLRTPLTRLRGTAEMALAGAAGSRTATARRWPTASRKPIACW